MACDVSPVAMFLVWYYDLLFKNDYEDDSANNDMLVQPLTPDLHLKLMHMMPSGAKLAQATV